MCSPFHVGRVGRVVRLVGARSAGVKITVAADRNPLDNTLDHG
ncbi:hypothetical protein SBD_3894 [Streptomyces bottropensis ATCC 25435]|uniref:Uncharacterized protein n=1 Tax=Streptomyces bottropensis ATCC 25435 TaxID=1054862 RepID=M3FMR1_9ACTN|nr:hypothetical protein SBD_3894 [Streptomyces bottropensis ATCC 25435]